MSENSVSSYQLKIRVINFIELAYKENDGVTTSLIKEKGPFTLKVNERGEAMLIGKAGTVRFDVSEEVKQIGLDLKMVSVMFSGGREGKLHYMASFNFAGGVKVEFSSILDIEKLILSCSGLLCRAARLLKGRHQQIDQSVGL
ncbi:hypothetical protein WG68_00420 [Arsukibacterium ikkense]|uniref:Uncharacterized protein n=1 Tax=Arsukibacterium ikkense TaxID=336831 RepID=A0A0M2VC42_9GAMM|nr:hypothetical protein [Arsukibacterium ikkense]KKO47155.1 hypothetical protein WG68_00420 [Arsukibacterium ikkense]